MRKKYILICLSLLAALFIYVFYRTGRTLVNEMLVHVISVETYTRLKAHIVVAWPLNDIIIYSLPEALWIFCITLTSKPFYIKLNNGRFYCIFIPLIFCFGLEILQLFHITRGRFDFMDIGLSVIFWILAAFVLKDGAEKRNIFTRPDTNMVICLASYIIVYLAHVFK